MVAEPTSLPELSERESHLLSVFLLLRYDMVALAEQEKLLPQHLLTFARSPAVAAHLAALREFAEQSFTLRSLESRTTALDTLEKVAKLSDDPMEQRRAASTILRGLGLQRDRRSPSLRERVGGRELTCAREPRLEPDLSPSSRSSGGGGVSAWGAHSGEGSVSTSSTHAPSPQIHESHPCPAPAPSPHSSLLTPHSPLPDLPATPTRRPNPSDTAKQVLELTLDTLQNLDCPAALPTLALFLAAGATINNAPCDAASLKAQLPALIPQLPAREIALDQPIRSPGPPETLAQVATFHHDSGITRARITVTRSANGAHPSHEAGWRLLALDRIDSS